MDILDLLASDNYIIVNKTLVAEIGLENAIVFGVLCSYQRGFGNDEFYREQEKIIEDTGLSEYIVRKAIKELKDLELIEVNKKGMPAKYFYKVNISLTFKFLKSSAIKSGTTSAIKSGTTSAIKSGTTNKNNINNNNSNINLSNNKLLSKPILEEKNSKKAFDLGKPSKKLTQKEKLYHKLLDEILVKSSLYQKDNIRDLLIRWINALYEINKLPSSISLEDSLLELSKYDDTTIINTINNSIKSNYPRFYIKENISSDGINKTTVLSDYEIKKQEESYKYIEEKYGNKS